MGNLEDLAKHRDALMLAEVAAWLHMFGKFHEGFLSGNHGLDVEIPSDIGTKFPQLYNCLTDNTWTGQVWQQLDAIIPELQAKDLSILDIISNHKTRSFNRRNNSINYTSGFLKVSYDAHGRGSSIEKGVLARFAQPQEVNVYLSSSLGYEPHTFINLTKVQNEREKLYSFLETKFSTLKAKNAKLSDDEWLYFRRDFIERIKQCFLMSVAESRRPLNDVTLFDQTAASVAFFKSALAQNLLMGWVDPNQSSYHWRLLYIGINSLDFWDKALRIGDLLARKDLIEQALDGVQTLIEVTYPLGLEVYRDINGSVFILPDIDNLKSYVAHSQTLEQHIQSIATKLFSNEAHFTLIPSESTRNTLSFGKLLATVLPAPVPQITWLQQYWANNRTDVCPVCNCRFQGPSRKALSRKVCNVCLTRRLNRSEQWIRNPSTIIWIDEVGDANGEVALLVAQFNVIDWLSGSTFNSILSVDPQSSVWIDHERNEAAFNFDLNTLTTDIQRGLSRPTETFQRGSLLANLVLKDSRGDTNYVHDFYNLRILGIDLENSLSLSRPETLELEMLRLSPSFSRISRVWETTKQFWEDISDTFKTTIYEIGSRIHINAVPIAKAGSTDLLGVSHTYELKLDNVNLSVVYIKEGEFLTVDNLRRVATLLGAPRELRRDYDSAATYVNARIQQTDLIDLEEPTGYGSPSNRVLTTIRIENTRLEGPSYVPAITIVNEPRTFMALLPAEKALDVATAIKTKYEKEMGKVRNRLPLTMGIVFAGIRTTLPAILDTGRRMLKQPTESSCWEIVKVEPEYPHLSWPDEVKLTLEQNGTSILVKVPTIMGDRRIHDIWYPYWCLEQGAPNTEKRERMFKNVDGKPWVHVTDLQKSDIVSFMPSRFDFEFLDTAARRFEVSYEHDKRRGNTRIARPYYLEQLEDLDKLWKMLSTGLFTTQIDTLVHLIEAKRQEWLSFFNQDDAVFKEYKPIFGEMVFDIIKNANWIEGKRPTTEEIRDFLCPAAIRGQLADVANLYMTILKQKTAVDEQMEGK